MWHTVKSYLRFLWNSKNEYGVHSPFVFDLVTKCLYDNAQYPQYEILQNYRESLLKNRDIIEVTDFGAGSRVFKSNRRQVAKIAKTAGISSSRAALLYRVTNYFKPSRVLEIGTSLGLATSALSLGNPAAKITTLEGCAETSGIAKKHVEGFGMENVDTVTTEFSTYLKDLQHSNFDLIYFDGNHQKEATLEYFGLLLETVANDSVWIFDDIHWSPDMEQAWEAIKENPKVSITIDTFQWGFVFFRTGQHKEHFTIRL